MFVTNLKNVGVGGFSPPASRGYLNTATGYPATLNKTLAKAPESFNVYGASGGVGDAYNAIYRIPITVSGNLYDINTYPLTTGKYVNGGNGNINNNSSYAVTNYIPCEHLQGKTVTLNKRLGRDANYPGIAFFSDAREYVAGEPNGNSRLATWTFTVPNNSYYMRFTVLADATDIMLNYGSEALPYEPYIEPIAYYFYSDTPLTANDILEIDPKAKTAVRYSDFSPTHISDIQDWTQDFKLPKADTLIVSADTTVEPGNIVVEYWSSRREEE